MYRPTFEYSRTPDTLFTVQLDLGRTLKVIGDRSNGCYEWIIEPCLAADMHSDCGYGQPDIALRDGLIAYHGVPNEIPQMLTL